MLENNPTEVYEINSLAYNAAGYYKETTVHCLNSLFPSTHIPAPGLASSQKSQSTPTLLKNKNLCQIYSIVLDLLTVILKNKGKNWSIIVTENSIICFHRN